jgi:hypothetical protein
MHPLLHPDKFSMCVLPKESNLPLKNEALVAEMETCIILVPVVF